MLSDVIESSTMQIAFMSWAQGFVAGVNIASVVDRGTYYDVAGKDGMSYLQDVVAYCRSNMDLQVISAADAILSTLTIREWPE